MIKLQDLTPKIYYDTSRDFQFIGRLYDIVLNSVKTNAANLYNLPCDRNMDEQLLNLLALTLGFKITKQQYNSNQLRALCRVLPAILKHKGSIQALVLAATTLLAAEGVTQELDYTVTSQGVILGVAQELEDLSLLEDLLDYLLPAGLNCTIIKKSKLVTSANTTIVYLDDVKVHKQESAKLSTIAATQNFNNLAFGEINTNPPKPSILSNTTVLPTIPESTQKEEN